MALDRLRHRIRDRVQPFRRFDWLKFRETLLTKPNDPVHVVSATAFSRRFLRPVADLITSFTVVITGDSLYYCYEILSKTLLFFYQFCELFFGRLRWLILPVVWIWLDLYRNVCDA